jgi:hypothetical protein
MKVLRNCGVTCVLHLAVLCLALIWFGAANAMPPPKYPLRDSISWSQRSEDRPATQLMMGSFKVRFEKTTLGQVIRAAGIGEIEHRGDAAESIYWLCYTAPDERVWIISGGEMGGRDHKVGQIVAQELRGVRSTKDCPALSSNLLPLHLDKSIWLGTTTEAATRDLGRPSHTDGSWQSFNYAGKVPGRCSPEGFDLLNWLLLKIEAGRVVELRAGQVTSC